MHGCSDENIVFFVLWKQYCQGLCSVLGSGTVPQAMFASGKLVKDHVFVAALKSFWLTLMSSNHVKVPLRCSAENVHWVILSLLM